MEIKEGIRISEVCKRYGQKHFFLGNNVAAHRSELLGTIISTKIGRNNSGLLHFSLELKMARFLNSKYNGKSCCS